MLISMYSWRGGAVDAAERGQQLPGGALEGSSTSFSLCHLPGGRACTHAHTHGPQLHGFPGLALCGSQLTGPPDLLSVSSMDRSRCSSGDIMCRKSRIRGKRLMSGRNRSPLGASSVYPSPSSPRFCQ